jgi:hypothetical protein
MTIDYTLHIILWIFSLSTEVDKREWVLDMRGSNLLVERTSEGVQIKGPPGTEEPPTQVSITERTVDGIMYPDSVDIVKELSLAGPLSLSDMGTLLCSSTKKVSCFKSISLSEKSRSFSYVHPKNPDVSMDFTFTLQ